MLNFYIPPEERKDMRYRLLVSWLIAAILTMVISASSVVRIIDQAIYSFAIGTLMWLFIDVGDLLLFKNAGKRFPFSKKRYLFATAAIFAANYCGFVIGDWLTVWDILTTNRTQVWIWAFLELVIASISCWFFLQQQRHKEDRRSTEEARLRLLESQLEPHMLYNTLANLRALVKTDPDVAVHMLDRIVAYMRATLGGSRATMHPLKVEFARLDDYLDLMKLRMGERLNYDLYLCPELGSYLVPPFILQPLVENAIKHGLEPKVEGGKISVLAIIEGNTVSLEVNDTGAGTSKDDLINTKGFGWTQVTERLMATYGKNSAINLVALDGYITSVKITLPYEEAESSLL